MVEHSEIEIRAFQKKILDWYEKNKRDLPWRDVPVETNHSVHLSGASLDQKAYHILVSEVMLQQTQVARVIPKYEAWLTKFPTLEDLANAKIADVLRLWSGLGYNQRALYLKRTAEMIVEKYSSSERSDREVSSRQARTIKFPKELEELEKLPGIGKYTAREIACFAFNQQVAVVDTNVRKVILVHFKHVIPDLIGDLDSRFRGNDKEEKVIDFLADQLLPAGRSYEWNQALMDYAAAELKQKIPFRPGLRGARQSKFIGSNRYYRGQILKMLLAEKMISTNSLAKRFAKVTPLKRCNLSEIVGDLEKEGLLKRKKDKVFLP